MTSVFNEYIEDNYIDFMINIILRWTKKSIQIPRGIRDKVLPLTELTNYLNETKNNNYELLSTQNFLQGVFNYMSSLKADVCNNYAIKLWYELYPESSMLLNYMVHSDDYVIMCSTNSIKEYEKFRVLHKICMRLCGITESTKKTNTQHIFMEFISLISFNGSVSYPQIKKTKEIATTLPCESFSNDSDAICSRTAECVRVGVDSYSTWLFHRFHMYLLRRMYSLHKGGKNYVEDKYNLPVEMFGQSDMLPIFYFLCRGDPNNYRLYTYSIKGQENLMKLYTITKEKYQYLEGDSNTFVKPIFIYNRSNTKINNLRFRQDIKAEDAFKFFVEKEIG